MYSSWARNKQGETPRQELKALLIDQCKRHHSDWATGDMYSYVECTANDLHRMNYNARCQADSQPIALWWHFASKRSKAALLISVCDDLELWLDGETMEPAPTLPELPLSSIAKQKLDFECALSWLEAIEAKRDFTPEGQREFNMAANAAKIARDNLFFAEQRQG
jgi:hypothetical protein